MAHRLRTMRLMDKSCHLLCPHLLHPKRPHPSKYSMRLLCRRSNRPTQIFLARAFLDTVPVRSISRIGTHTLSRMLRDNGSCMIPGITANISSTMRRIMWSISSLRIQIMRPVVASSGALSSSGEYQTYTLTAGRTFVFAASPEFQVASTQVGNVSIASYYFPAYDAAGQAALNATAQAVQIYSQRYGPYPHQTLAVVMGDFNDGMEFSGFFYLSRDFYNLYDGTLKNYLVFVAAHETAHQWWFEQVANDQATQPWLDEALATYSERIFYEIILSESCSVVVVVSH